MPPLRRALLVCVTAAGLGMAGTVARGAIPPEPQRSPTAHCRDGTYYYGAKNKRVACAHHRGVAEWLAASNRPAASRAGARAPKGATARCRDGTYSFVHARARACAAHRGIARWLGAR